MNQNAELIGVAREEDKPRITTKSDLDQTSRAETEAAQPKRSGQPLEQDQAKDSQQSRRQIKASHDLSL